MNFLDTITLRRRRRSRTVSDDTMANIEDSKLSLDGTTNSMPLISDDDEDDKIKTLKEKIEQISMELRTAHEEISSLNLENAELKITIEKLKNDNEIMKKVTNSLKNDIATPKRKKGNKTNNISGGPMDNPNSTKKESSIAKKKQKLNTPSPTLRNKPSSIPNPDKVNAQTQTNFSRPNTNNSVTKTTVHKNRRNNVVITSSNTRNALLDQAEKSLGHGESKLCHFKYINGGIKEQLSGLLEKTKDLTLNDYYIMIIGEKDFESSRNYFELVTFIRGELQKVHNTNIIICLPTFRCNEFSTMYNWRVETFNNLLYMDNLSYEYAYILDSNLNLSFDSNNFTGQSGFLNDKGLTIVFRDLSVLMQHIQAYNAKSLGIKDKFESESTSENSYESNLFRV